MWKVRILLDTNPLPGVNSAHSNKIPKERSALLMFNSTKLFITPVADGKLPSRSAPTDPI